jgi:4-oxalocrotonate tautomerase family enzyme
MPFVKVEIIKGRSDEYKKLLLQTIHEALISIMEVEEDDRYQRLYELDLENFERRAAKTDKFTLIELNLFPGRSKELKRELIKGITSLLGERLEIRAADIIIIIHEPPLDNWGCYGEQASELKFKYKKE